MITTEALLQIALDLQLGISHHDRFQRLINSVRTLFVSDASALLRYERGQFIPLAIDGLSADTLGRRFRLTEHPRLEAIARAGNVVRFPADSDLPDPYDGLLPQHELLKVHACIGLPLFAEQNLIGALTIDGLDPHQFDAIDDQALRLVGALAAAALTNGLLLEQLSRQSIAPPNSESERTHDDEELLGDAEPMRRLRHEISVVAPSDLNVLILGETGVGKELIAQAVHRGSARQDKPLVYLNCAALPESVAESELFGHIKGAFTGAIHNRAGKFELADNGTLFLDEIGELSLSLQAKLLRVLQYGDIQRIGEDRALTVNVRILAATNRDLKDEVVEGRFRADLFHRLSVFPLLAPPLRQRSSDIPLLAGYFAERCRARLGLDQLILAADTMQQLIAYSWPGNVRELEHAIARAAVLARAEQATSRVRLLPMHLNLLSDTQPPNHAMPDPVVLEQPLMASSAGLKVATDTFQAAMIRRSLQLNQGSWAATARSLALDPGNLHRVAKRLGLK
ncbi:MAG: nitric oxide reductase transcriptional regulator NorR [Shewanella sp.]